MGPVFQSLGEERVRHSQDHLGPEGGGGGGEGERERERYEV